MIAARRTSGLSELCILTVRMLSHGILWGNWSVWLRYITIRPAF